MEGQMEARDLPTFQAGSFQPLHQGPHQHNVYSALDSRTLLNPCRKDFKLCLRGT